MSVKVIKTSVNNRKINEDSENLKTKFPNFLKAL